MTGSDVDRYVRDRNTDREWYQTIGGLEENHVRPKSRGTG